VVRDPNRFEPVRFRALRSTLIFLDSSAVDLVSYFPPSPSAPFCHFLIPVCQRFPVFDGYLDGISPIDVPFDVLLQTCHKHLSNTSTYYLPGADIVEIPYRAESESWSLLEFTLAYDNANFISVLTVFSDIFGQFFSPECLSNIEGILCHAAFKECQKVDDDWFPSLMCRSECERRNAIWDSCLATLEKDPEAKTAFDEAITEMVAPYTLYRRSLVFFAVCHGPWTSSGGRTLHSRYGLLRRTVLHAAPHSLFML
jgi:hypothetical protein